MVDEPDQQAGPEREELDPVRRGEGVAELVGTGAQGVVVTDVLPVLQQVVRVGRRRVVYLGWFNDRSIDFA
jgi:hypothetical protein